MKSNSEGSDPGNISRDQLELVACGPEHRAEQAELFAACFKKGDGPEHLGWRYDDCPHGQSVSIVARPPGGRAISGYACNPRTVLHFGREATRTTVGETGDVMTHPDWRKRGIFSDLDRRAMEETGRLGWSAVFGLPNRRSAHIFLELGWEQVGLIRPHSFVVRKSPASKAERFKEGRLAALLTGFHATQCGRAAKRLSQAAGASFVAERLERFPEEVEELARRVEQNFAFMVRRDAAYLNWRFLDNPSGLHRAVGIRTRQGALVGYAVVQLPRAGSSVGWLVDVLAPDEPARARAICAGLDLLREHGAEVIQAHAIDGSFWERCLSGAGFLPPKPENHLIVILYRHDRQHPAFADGVDAASWYLTDGDRDDETVG